MYGGDASRKHNLVEYGYRLPAAMDNRPLRFEEFEALENDVIYVSATPPITSSSSRRDRSSNSLSARRG